MDIKKMGLEELTSVDSQKCNGGESMVVYGYTGSNGILSMCIGAYDWYAIAYNWWYDQPNVYAMYGR